MDLTKEATDILETLAGSLKPEYDGRQCIQEMYDQDFNQWAQDEWAGWYFEHIGIPRLRAKFGGNSERVLNTTFDYSLSTVWDFKVHMAKGHRLILNAQDSMNNTIGAGKGFGFVVLTAKPVYDETDEFKDWHHTFKVENGKPPRLRKNPEPPKYKRRRKVSIQPVALDAFCIPNDDALEYHYKSTKAIGIMAQGVQGDGSPRKPKYTCRLNRAKGTDLHLAHLDL